MLCEKTNSAADLYSLSMSGPEVMLVIGGFNVFISVYLITGGGPAQETEVLLTYMYRQAFGFLEFGYGSSLAFMLTLTVFALALIQLRLLREKE